MEKKKIRLPSNKNLGIFLTAETIRRDKFYFDFPKFKEGKEYPRIVKINPDSISFKEGLRVGNTLLELNGFSFYKKDLSTIMCDFDYEKRSSKFLNIVYY